VSERTELQRMAAQAFPDQERLHRMVPEAARARGLQQILGERRLHAVPPPASGGRRWDPAMVVGVVVVWVLVAVAVFVLPGTVGERPLPEVAGPAPAPAPAPVADPAEVLGQLADRAAAQPPVPAKPSDYVRVMAWGPTTVFADGVETDRSGDPVIAGQEELVESESWSDADGFGRTRIRLGEGSDSGTGSVTDIGSGAGEVRYLPADPAAFEAALLALRAGGWETPSVYDRMVLIWSGQVVEPPVQAAFLRLLATKDGVQVLGPVTDRVGRQGLAVTVSHPGRPTGQSSPNRIDYRFVVDPATGALLEYERADFDRDRCTSRRGTVWLDRGRVDSIAEFP
jgi:hypothetical protein